MIVGDSLLSCQLLGDQLPRDLNGSSRVIGKRLSASEPGVGRADWASRGEHGAIPFKHDECGVLIGQPPERREGNESI
jgi:hypothetical protein